MKKDSGKPGDIFDKKIIKQLWFYLKPYRKDFYLLILMTVILAVLGPIRPKLVQTTIDDYVSVGNVNGMLILVAIIILTIVFQAVLEYFHSFKAGFIGQNVVKDLRVKLYNHMMKFKVSFFDQTPVGRLITRNVSDLETIADIFSEGVAAIAGDLLQIIAIMALMFYTDWKLTLVSLSLIPFLFLATYVFKEKIKGSFNETRLAVSNLNTFV
ncbi:MAG: ABC transporter ATP-binding protein, partial [Cytophagales bacterium]